MPLPSNIRPDQMFYVELRSIERIDKPYDQTVAFVTQVDSWLKQWTVKNNYDPAIVRDPKEALTLFLFDFKVSFNSSLSPSLVPKGTNIEDHFLFRFWWSEVKVGRQFVPDDNAVTIDCSELTES